MAATVSTGRRWGVSQLRRAVVAPRRGHLLGLGPALEMAMRMAMGMEVGMMQPLKSLHDEQDLGPKRAKPAQPASRAAGRQDQDSDDEEPADHDTDRDHRQHDGQRPPVALNQTPQSPTTTSKGSKDKTNNIKLMNVNRYLRHEQDLR